MIFIKSTTTTTSIDRPKSAIFLEKSIVGGYNGVGTQPEPLWKITKERVAERNMALPEVNIGKNARKLPDSAYITKKDEQGA